MKYVLFLDFLNRFYFRDIDLCNDYENGKMYAGWKMRERGQIIEMTNVEWSRVNGLFAKYHTDHRRERITKIFFHGSNREVMVGAHTEWID